jgi:hypothetical protein
MIRAIGLHITRTAGTSLYSALSSAMVGGSALQISSFLNDEESGLASIFERDLQNERLQLVFGHYVHEALMFNPMWSHAKRFVFYREPIARLWSELQHLTSGYVVNLSLDELVAERADGWCNELLRAVPSANVAFASRPLWERAGIVLSLFDRIWLASELEVATEEMADYFGFPRPPIIKMNSYRDALIDFDVNSLSSFCENDLQLFSVVRAGGLAEFQNSSAELHEALVERYQDLSYSDSVFVSHLYNFLKSELGTFDTKLRYFNKIKKRE